MSALQVRCLHDAAELLALGKQINALNLQAERPDPFATCEFYCNFLQHGLVDGASGVKLWFLAVFDGAELVGYLALRQVMRRRFGLHSKRLEFLVGHEADRPQLIARPEHVGQVSAAVYAYLLERRREWSFLELQGQMDGSPLDPARLGLPLRGCLVRDFPNWDNCTVHVGWNTMQQYVHTLSKSTRYDVRHKLQGLQALGTLELLTSSDPIATPALFDLYRSIEARSWKSQTEVAIGSAVRVDYLKGLLDPRQPMQIVIQILLLDGLPIAGLIFGSFATAQRKDLHALHIVFDSRLSAVGPGSISLLLGMRFAIEHGYSSVNLLAGFAYYKKRWLAQTTATRSIQIYRRFSLPFWRRLLGDARRSLQLRAQRSFDGFNPLRRQSTAQQHAIDVPAERQFEVTQAEREHAADLVAQAHRGRCTRLCAAEIMASAPQAQSSKAKAEARVQHRGKKATVQPIRQVG
jgi:hypothetical protein